MIVHDHFIVQPARRRARRGRVAVAPRAGGRHRPGRLADRRGAGRWRASATARGRTAGMSRPMRVAERRADQEHPDLRGDRPPGQAAHRRGPAQVRRPAPARARPGREVHGEPHLGARGAARAAEPWARRDPGGGGRLRPRRLGGDPDRAARPRHPAASRGGRRALRGAAAARAGHRRPRRPAGDAARRSREMERILEDQAKEVAQGRTGLVQDARSPRRHRRQRPQSRHHAHRRARSWTCSPRAGRSRCTRRAGRRAPTRTTGASSRRSAAATRWPPTARCSTTSIAVETPGDRRPRRRGRADPSGRRGRAPVPDAIQRVRQQPT